MKLKPCPFCCSTRVQLYTEWHPRFTAECDKCGAQGPATDSFEQAALWWNEVPRHDKPKAVRARYAAQLRAMSKAWDDRVAEEKRAERNSLEQLRADKKWAAERQAWLDAPVPGDN